MLRPCVLIEDAPSGAYYMRFVAHVPWWLCADSGPVFSLASGHILGLYIAFGVALSGLVFVVCLQGLLLLRLLLLTTLLCSLLVGIGSWPCGDTWQHCCPYC